MKDYQPSGKDVVVRYEIVPHQREDFHACLQVILDRLQIAHDGKNQRGLLKAFALNQEDLQASVAFPQDIFEPENMPQHLAIVAGAIFDHPQAKRVRVMDIQWPESLQASFPGPAHGMTRLRQDMKIYDRPLSSVLLLPKSGLSIKAAIEKAYQVWMGGCDMVEDSEMIASALGNDFDERIEYLSKEQINCTRRTSQQKCYIPNITAGSLAEMQRRAKKARDMELKAVVVSAYQIGHTGLSALRQTCRELDLYLTAHHAGHSVLDQRGASGFAPVVMARIFRHLGVDLLHIRSDIKNDDLKSEVEGLNDPFHEQHRHQAPTMPICSDIAHAGNVEGIIKHLGHDLILQTGQSVYDHPDGIKAGAEAFQAAILAAAQGIGKIRAAEKNEALGRGLKAWEKADGG